MSVNGVNQYTNAAVDLLTSSKASAKDAGKTKTETDSQKTAENSAAVYESSQDSDKKSNQASKLYKKEDRSSIVKALKEDAAKREQSMLDLVNRTLGKQAYSNALATNNLSSLFKGENLSKFSPDAISQAKKDVAEDGYWGVKQTSDRLVSFAYALAGGDSSKADTLMKAIEKGYNQATRAWGDKLPDISSRTLDAVREKMQSWKDGTYTPQ